MYPKPSLYKNYLKYSCKNDYLPDVTFKTTMGMIDHAINICDSWENFMDIGGGTGKNAIALSRTFKKGTLVEVYNHEEHKEIRKNFDNIEIFNDLIENYKIKGDKFDFILLADLFEHIPNIEIFIKQISELKTPSGVVYMMTPNPFFCGPAPESGIYHTKKEYGHIKHYTSQEIVSLMKIGGYELIFKYHEESNLRRKLKNFIKAISRRDANWRNNILYKTLRPFILPFLKLIFKIVEKVTYNSEARNSNNPFTTITQNLAFKKIK